MLLKIAVVIFTTSLLAYPGEVIPAESLSSDPVTGMEFVFIKGGCYEMGDSVGDGDSNERPVHEVCLSDFYLGKYEVTNAQFRKFRPTHNSGAYETFSLNDDKQPVVNVSWDDAVAYAKWLSEKTGKTFRLPTEAEWEYAARAGTRSSRYWGKSLEDSCKYANGADMVVKKYLPRWTAFPCDDGYAVAAPVGSFRPNGLGLYDMLGNVWEWCQDVYDDKAYTKVSRNNPVYEGRGKYRVERGGGWSNGPLGLRSSHRVGLTASFGHHSLGFRVVRMP
jgi:formylglycine-generating enzyme required for sulfatase activity